MYYYIDFMLYCRKQEHFIRSTQSITFAIKMDVIERIKKVDKFFENILSPEGHQLNQFLARNEEELREQKMQHVSNLVACSKACFVSGVLTFFDS